MKERTLAGLRVEEADGATAAERSGLNRKGEAGWIGHDDSPAFFDHLGTCTSTLLPSAKLTRLQQDKALLETMFTDMLRSLDEASHMPSDALCNVKLPYQETQGFELNRHYDDKSQYYHVPKVVQSFELDKDKI